MEAYRIANFVVQSAYLLGHLAFSELISRTYGEIDRAIDAIRANLAAAKEGSPRAREALRENLGLAQDCIARIRLAVAQLKEA